jgi:hypothetical protein
VNGLLTLVYGLLLLVYGVLALDEGERGQGQRDDEPDAEGCTPGALGPRCGFAAGQYVLSLQGGRRGLGVHRGLA